MTCAVRLCAQDETIEKVKFLSGFCRSISLALVRFQACAVCRPWTAPLAGDHLYSGSFECVEQRRASVRELRTDFIDFDIFITSVDGSETTLATAQFLGVVISETHKSNNDFNISFGGSAACFAASLRCGFLQCLNTSHSQWVNHFEVLGRWAKRNQVVLMATGIVKVHSERPVDCECVRAFGTASERKPYQRINYRNKCTGSRSQLLTHVYANAFWCR